MCKTKNKDIQPEGKTPLYLQQGPPVCPEQFELGQGI